MLRLCTSISIPAQQLHVHKHACTAFGLALAVLYQRYRDALATMVPSTDQSTNLRPAREDHVPTFRRVFSIDRASPKVDRAVGTPRPASRSLRLRDRSLQETFKTLAGDDGLLQFPCFRQALVERVQISLSEEEIERVWSRIVRDRKTTGSELEGRSASTSEPNNARLTFEEFEDAVQNVSFLRNIARHLCADAGGFAVPASYDYSKSTNDNYSVGADRSFHGLWHGGMRVNGAVYLTR